MKVKTPRGSKVFRRLLVAAAILALAWGVIYGTLRSQDARHARFYDTGKSVNKFLSDYSSALRDGHMAGKASFLADYVSEQFRSPQRGQWRFEERDVAADVRTSILTAVGEGDYGPSDLETEVAAYLAEIETIDRLDENRHDRGDRALRDGPSAGEIHP